MTPWPLDDFQESSHLTQYYQVLPSLSNVTKYHINFYQSLYNALCESCENGVWSGQLWQINSPPIFVENLPKFQLLCLNIQIFEKVINFQNLWEKGWWKLQKTCWGCCDKISWVSKELSQKTGFILENAFFVTRPPNTKKMYLKSEIIKF